MCTRLHTSQQIFLREYYQERLCMVLEPLALVSALTLAMVLQYVIAKCIMLAKNKLLQNQLTHDSATTRKSPICFFFRFKLLITAALVALPWCIIDASQNRQLLMTRSHRQDRRSLCPGNEAGHVVISCSAKKQIFLLRSTTRYLLVQALLGLSRYNLALLAQLKFLR